MVMVPVYLDLMLVQTDVLDMLEGCTKSRDNEYHNLRPSLPVLMATTFIRMRLETRRTELQNLVLHADSRITRPGAMINGS